MLAFTAMLGEFNVVLAMCSARLTHEDQFQSAREII